MEPPRAAPPPYAGWLLNEPRKVVVPLSEDTGQSHNSHGFPWAWVIYTIIIGIFTVFLFLWRGFRSVRSWCYVVREKKLAALFSGLIKEKCELLEKLRLAEKEYEGLESSLIDANLQELEVQALKATYEELGSCKSKLEDEVLFLEKQLEGPRERTSRSDPEPSPPRAHGSWRAGPGHAWVRGLLPSGTADISQRIQTLKDELKIFTSEIAEAEPAIKIFPMNIEQLRVEAEETFNENSQLQGNLNQPLTEHSLKMKDWSAVFGEDVTDDDSVELGIKSDSENGVPLDNQHKGAMKKMTHADELSAHLKSLKRERNKIRMQLSQTDKANEYLAECVKHLQTEQALLQSVKTEVESETQKLQRKLTVMTELHQGNEMKLRRKLSGEGIRQLEEEEKLSRANETLSYTVEELETYRKRVKDLEEELERTIRFYHKQIIFYEKISHHYWWAARTAKRKLEDLKKASIYNRHKSTEVKL